MLHIYPSSYTKQYKETVEPSVIKMLKGIGLKNAFLSLQGFVTDDGFAFHETGLRMGGGQSYVFTEILNGVSSLDLMIEFAVTGKMSSIKAKEKDNPFFSKVCANYYIVLKDGTISTIDGVDSVRNMPQVLQIMQFKNIGDVINLENSLDSVCFRIHVMDDTKESLAKTIEQISNTLQIKDSKGNNMQLEIVTFQRALEIINAS